MFHEEDYRMAGATCTADLQELQRKLLDYLEKAGIVLPAVAALTIPHKWDFTSDQPKSLKKEELPEEFQFLSNTYRPFLMKQSEEAAAAKRYIEEIKDSDKRLYAQRYFFYLLGYDLKPPSPRPLKEEEARELQVALDKFFETSTLAATQDEEWVEKEGRIKDRAERQRLSKERLLESVDPGIRDVVRQLNLMGYTTISSCSGMMADHGWKIPGPSYIIFLADDPSKIEKIERSAQKVGLHTCHGTYKPEWYWSGWVSGIEVSKERPTGDEQISKLWQRFKSELEAISEPSQYSTTVEDRFQITCSRRGYVRSEKPLPACGFLGSEKTLSAALETAKRLQAKHTGEGESVEVFDLMAHKGNCELWDVEGHCIGYKGLSSWSSLRPQTKNTESLPFTYEEKRRKTLAAFMEMGEWFVKHRRYMTIGDIRAIGTKHFGTGGEYTEFLEYLGSSEGLKEFRRELRQIARRHGISLPPEEEWLPLTELLSETRKHWVEIKDPGSSSYVRGAIIPYQEFEVERKKILERGGKLPSIEISHEPPPGNGNGDKQLPATVEAEPVPEKYKWLIPFIGDEPLPPEANTLLPAVVPQEGERKIDAVLKRLAEGVESIHDSGQFRLFLTTMAKFHDYSYSNQILIMLQKPEATRVAGFMTWKDLGRWVKKGESGISILAPVMPPKPKKEEREEEEEEEIVPLTPVYFRPVTVFDISQTEGKPLPEFDVPVLTGEANEDLYGKVLVMAKAQGLDMSFESRPHQDPAIKGQYSAPKSIWVRPEESKAQQLKSLLHEIAHYYSEGVFRIPRRDAETIAESAAFAVGAHYGFDSGVRSFPYVALWAQDKKTLSQNLNTIRKVADTMLHALEGSKQPILTQTMKLSPDSPEGQVLLDPKLFPKRTEALRKLKNYKVMEVHDDGDLTIQLLREHLTEKGVMVPTDTVIVVTTDGQTFKEEYLAGREKEKLLPFAVTKGTCYQDAWRFLLKEKEGYLVHGTVWSEDKRTGHAWVETETGYIWEPQTGQFYTKLSFDDIAAPVEESRYTTEQASVMAARAKHFGPWTDEERGRYLKGKASAVIPTKPPPPSPREELEFVSDSPDFIPFTIDQIGYRDKLDNAFQSRIAQVQGRR